MCPRLGKEGKEETKEEETEEWKERERGSEGGRDRGKRMRYNLGSGVTQTYSHQLCCIGRARLCPGLVRVEGQGVIRALFTGAGTLCGPVRGDPSCWC